MYLVTPNAQLALLRDRLDGARFSCANQEEALRRIAACPPHHLVHQRGYHYPRYDVAVDASALPCAPLNLTMLNSVSARISPDGGRTRVRVTFVTDEPPQAERSSILPAPLSPTEPVRQIIQIKGTDRRRTYLLLQGSRSVYVEASTGAVSTGADGFRRFRVAFTADAGELIRETLVHTQQELADTEREIARWESLTGTIELPNGRVIAQPYTSDGRKVAIVPACVAFAAAPQSAHMPQVALMQLRAGEPPRVLRAAPNFKAPHYLTLPTAGIGVVDGVVFILLDAGDWMYAGLLAEGGEPQPQADSDAMSAAERKSGAMQRPAALPAGCCPRCGAERLAPTDGGFMEQGEWNGSNYEAEFDTYGFRCTDCGFVFYVADPSEIHTCLPYEPDPNLSSSAKAG